MSCIEYQSNETKIRGVYKLGDKITKAILHGFFSYATDFSSGIVDHYLTLFFSRCCLFATPSNFALLCLVKMTNKKDFFTNNASGTPILQLWTHTPSVHPCVQALILIKKFCQRFFLLFLLPQNSVQKLGGALMHFLTLCVNK